MLEKHDLSAFPGEFAKSYFAFELDRAQNGDLPEEKQDPSLAAYTDAAKSGQYSIDALQARTS